MKWLQDNPLGIALVGISGVFLLLAAILALVWTLPVVVETAETAAQENGGTDGILLAHQVGSLSAYQVINERPVFNESRLPVISKRDGEGSAEDVTVAIKDAPDVRLTGVIITPSVRIASLTPADGKQESVMAYEGQSLTGEYVGWQVSSVNPRDVVLESLDGQTMGLDLEIHDATIKAPARQAPVAKPGSAVAEKTGVEGEQPLSRAEQIRQRIAERREELRREQEDKGAQNRPAQRQTTQRQAPNPQGYQNAIRALMKNNSKDRGNSGKKDG